MRFIFAVLLFGLVPVFASADPVLGVWQTEPDRKGQVAFIQVHSCKSGLCARVSQTFDASGNTVVTPHLGKRVFWNGKPGGKNRYTGRAWVPSHDRVYNARLKLVGNRLTVRGCFGPVCMAQKWSRVQ